MGPSFKKQRSLLFVEIILICLGIIFILKASYLPAKAFIGQKMLLKAWERTIETGEPQKSWKWADFTPIAKLSIKHLGVTLVALDSASGEALAWGPGLINHDIEIGLDGTAFIVGHRDSHMRFLKDLKIGENLTLELSNGEEQTYQAVRSDIVDSRTWKVPTDPTSTTSIALVTCWPFDETNSGPERYILYANLV
jgi:sortase A